MIKKHIFRAAGSAAIFAMTFFGSCSSHNHEGHDDHDDHDHAMEAPHDDDEDGHEGEHHEGEAHEGEIKMSHEAMEASGIKIATITTGIFHDVIKASGVIENTKGAQRVISAPATGVVSFSRELSPGAAVGTGSRLFTVSSRGLEQSDASATLHLQKDIAAKELKRAESLLADRLISQQEYDRAKSDYEIAARAAAGVGAKSAAGMAVSSPMSGYLVSLDVRPGSFVEMGEPMATVAADKNLILRADVSERYRNALHDIRSANISVSGSDKVISLADYSPRVLTTTPSTGRASHYIPVYIEFRNPGGLTSGNIVEIWLQGAPKSGVITVPKSALVEEGGYYYVYQEVHEHTFKKVEVIVGATDGRNVEILNGLKGGEKIAVTGALRIRMAGMGSGIQGHSHHH